MKWMKWPNRGQKQKQFLIVMMSWYDVGQRSAIDMCKCTILSPQSYTSDIMYIGNRQQFCHLVSTEAQTVQEAWTLYHLPSSSGYFR